MVLNFKIITDKESVIDKIRVEEPILGFTLFYLKGLLLNHLKWKKLEPSLVSQVIWTIPLGFRMWPLMCITSRT